MNLLNGFNAIVIVGMWNRYIFNQEWVAKNLLPEKELKVEIPMNPGASQRISSDDVRIFVVGNQLNLSPIKINNDILDNLQDISFKIADYLPHTPVTAFGVNFLYEEDKSKVIDDILDFADKNNIERSVYTLSTTSFRHSFKDIEDSILNLSISYADEKIRFDFNFHYNIKALYELKEKLTAHSVVRLKTTSEKLLNDIYLKK